jgi:hypothetical protein
MCRWDGVSSVLDAAGFEREDCVLMVGAGMEQPRWQASLRDRVRYLFDRTLARSTGALLGWLAVCCLAVVMPVSTLLVWTDPAAPRSVAGRLMASAEICASAV